MKVLSVILFIASFIILRGLFAVLISNEGSHMIFADQIMGFLFITLKGKWFLEYNSKWFYIFSIPIFYIIVSILIRSFALSLILITLSPITIYLSFKAHENKTFIKNILVVLFISSLSSYYIFPNYFHLYYTYIDKEETKIHQPFPNINLVDKNTEQIIFDTNKIIVLDFWTTSCGVCFKEFPLYNDLTLQYKEDNRIEFYSVNVPLKKDTFENNIKIIEGYNYSFKNIYAQSSEEIKDKLNIFAFPTIIIIKNDTIVYQGHPSYDKIILKNNFKRIIERLLNGY